MHCLTLQYTLCCLLSSENVGQRQSDFLLNARLTHWLAHCSLHVGFRVKVRNLMIQSARTNTGLLSASATAINIKFLIFISYLQPCLGCKIRRVLQEPHHLHKTLPTFSARLIDLQDIIDSLSSNHMYQARLLVCQKLSFQFSWSRTYALAPVFVFPVDPMYKIFFKLLPEWVSSLLHFPKIKVLIKITMLLLLKKQLLWSEKGAETCQAVQILHEQSKVWPLRKNWWRLYELNQAITFLYFSSLGHKTLLIATVFCRNWVKGWFHLPVRPPFCYCSSQNVNG